MCNSHAQFYNGSQMTFGKNRIQHNEERIWSQFRFKNFDVLFYQDGKKIAINASKYATEALANISSQLNYKPEKKLHFIVFNSLSELKSSNIGLDNEVLYNIGGVTNVIDNKVILYFDGNYLNLESQIRGGIAKAIINQIIYGEQIGRNIKNSTLTNFPPWYVDGLVSYFSEEWSSKLDQDLRNLIITKKLKNFNHLEGADATLAGHSIWKYIAQQYGKDLIPNIIYMTKVSHSVENGFLFVLGISLKNLSNNWYNNTLSIYNLDKESREEIPEHNALVKIKKRNSYYQVKSSPNGKYFSYVADKYNKKKLFLANNETGKKKKLFRLGTKMENIPDMSFPVTAWHPTSNLFIWEVENKGRIKLYLYNTETKSRDEFYLENVNKVLDMAYSPDGSLILMSAVINGYSDIFLFSTGSRVFTRITNDIFDDLNPRFIDNGKTIVFASNRVNDTISLEKETYLTDYSKPIIKQETFDLFAYDFATKNPVLRRVTNTPAINETKPMPWGNKYFTFLSDENGIYNRKLGYFDSTIAFVDTSIHYNYFTKTFSSSNLPANILEQESYINSNEIVQNFKFGKSTIINIQEKKSETDILLSEPKNTVWANERNLNFIDLQMKKDSIKQSKNTNKQGFISTKTDSGSVNINNYKFTTKTNEKEQIKPDTFILPHQQNYDVEYGFDKIVSQIDFSFLNVSYQPFNYSSVSFGNVGNNGLFKVSVSDLLEDKRIIGAFRTSFSFSNNEYFLSYEDLSKRLDKQIVAHRMTYNGLTENTVVKHHVNDINYILKWPFSQVLAIKGTALLKYDNQVFRSLNDYSLAQKDINTLWGGAKLELVFDNTRNPMMNIFYGLRYKIFTEYYQGVNKSELNLITAGFDFRHYSKIHRTFIWANRFAFGTSFGSTRLLYYLGGTDNTFLPLFNYDQPVDTSMHFAFQTLATNMRGFKQNIRNGNTFAVINSELRFPVFRYIFNRPIKSQFINNFQVVGFGDIGSAWLGLNPFSEENIMIPTYYQQKPITVVIRTPQNPIVGGVGFGLRTTVLGYFLRFDVAWGIEELKINAPRYVLSFSLDF